MDIFEAIKNRRSVRAFTKEQVSDAKIKKLISAACCAPSAGNIQPWEFIVVRDPEVKKGLCLAALDQSFIEQAPVVIVVCANATRSSARYGQRGANLYCLQDTAAATQTMLLAAHAMGLSACWVGAFQEDQATSVLNLPNGIRPVAIVPIGHPAEKPAARRRRPLHEIAHYESFGAKQRIQY